MQLSIDDWVCILVNITRICLQRKQKEKRKHKRNFLETFTEYGGDFDCVKSSYLSFKTTIPKDKYNDDLQQET